MPYCLALGLLLAAWPSWSQEQPSYSRGTIIRITTQSLFQASRERPTVQSNSEHTSDTGAYAKVRVLFIRRGSTTFAAQALDSEASYPGKLHKGSPVQFRLEGKDLYLKDPAGGEIRLRILETNPKGPLRKSE
jgi:hypothetical protein